MTYQTLIVERTQDNPQVATIMLNRPDIRNAFNQTTIAEITIVFTELAAQQDIHAIVLAANGTAFCAGGDPNWMKAMAGYTSEENRTDAAQLATMLHTIYHFPKPVIARVQGECYAGGLGLIAACDIVVALQEADFYLSEVRIGLIHRLVTTEILDDSVNALLKALLAASPNAVTDPSACREVTGQPLNAALIAATVERIAQSRARLFRKTHTIMAKLITTEAKYRFTCV